MRITDVLRNDVFETYDKEQYDPVAILEIDGVEFEFDYDDVVDLAYLLLAYIEQEMMEGGE